MMVSQLRPCFNQAIKEDPRDKATARATVFAPAPPVSCGGRIVEGYAVEPRAERVPDVFAFPGLARSYRAAGFHEAARRSATRPIMRRVIRARGGGAR